MVGDGAFFVGDRGTRSSSSAARLVGATLLFAPMPSSLEGQMCLSMWSVVDDRAEENPARSLPLATAAARRDASVGGKQQPPSPGSVMKPWNISMMPVDL